MMNIPKWLLVGVGGVIIAGLFMGVLVPVLISLEVDVPRWGLQAISAAVTAGCVYAIWVVTRKSRSNNA